MNRRDFFRCVGGAGVVAATVSSGFGFGLIQELWKRWVNRYIRKTCTCTPDKLCNTCKEAIILQALKTSEGRGALAQSMVEPIRRSLDYQRVGRKLLLVDELPQGALAYYERDIAVTR